MSSQSLNRWNGERAEALDEIESAHAVAECIRLAPTLSQRDILIINLSGRGDKDMGILSRELKLKGASDKGSAE